MNLKYLDTLIAIVDNKSFQTAARQLNMTLSAVSMQMKSLENDLNVQLFDRHFRPPKLTPIGRQIVEQARYVSQELAHLYAVSRAGGGLAGRFRIGFVRTASVRLLPGFLLAARDRAPHASFVVETGLSDDLIEGVEQGLLDAAIVTRANLPRALKRHVITHEELLYCLPGNAHKRAIEDCVTVLPFIHFMPQTGIGQLIADHLSKQAIEPREVIVLDSVEAVAECVGAGVGFAILPKPDIERHRHQDIILRPLAERPVTRQLVFVHKREGGLAQNADEVVAFFRSQ